MSSEKTGNLGLHKWAPTDGVLRTEFNDNFAKLDEKTAEVTSQLTDIAINIKTFGATGDGVDDKLPISAALKKNEDIVLYFPRGTYNLPNWVTLNTNKKVTIIGEGRHNTIIKGGSAVDFINANNTVKLINVSFDTWNNVVNFDNFVGVIDELTVQSCGFKNLNGCSVRCNVVPVDSKISNILLDSNVIENGGKFGFSISSLYENATVTKNKISGIYSASTSVAGIRLGDDTHTKQLGYKRAVIKNNYITNVSNGGDFECQGIIIYGSYALIEGNFLQDVFNVAGTSCEGIYSKSLHGTICSNILVNAGRYEASINIKGYIRNTAEVGHKGYAQLCYGNHIVCTITNQELNGISTMSEDIKIYDNVIEGITGTGIKVVAKNDKQNIMIKDNLIKNSLGMYGITLEGSSVKRMMIEGNIIDGISGAFGSTSVYAFNIMNNSTTSIEDVYIKGNITKNIVLQAGKTTANLNVNNATTAGLKNLVIKDNNFGDATRGIIWANPNNNIEGVIIENNIFGTMSSYVTYQPPANSIIRNNTGYKTENRGNVTISAASSSIVVSHGLNIPPAVTGVFLSPTSQVDASIRYWVSAVTSSTFTISLSGATPTDLALNWQIFSPYRY